MNLTAGHWENLEELRAKWAEDKRLVRAMSGDLREILLAASKKAVTRTFDWVD